MIIVKLHWPVCRDRQDDNRAGPTEVNGDNRQRVSLDRDLCNLAHWLTCIYLAAVVLISSQLDPPNPSISHDYLP
jgi:hypothetical protein